MTIHFFGDSNTAAANATPASWYVPTDAENHGVPGATIDDVLAQVDAHPGGDVAVIQGGINSLAGGKTPAYVSDKMAEAEAAAWPKFETVLVVPLFPTSLNLPVIETNALMAHSFPALFGMFEDPPGSGTPSTFYVQSDGVHLTPAGQRLVAREVVIALGTYSQADWCYGILPAAMNADARPYLERRWEVWPKPITGEYAGNDGYTGAFCCMATPNDYHVSAVVRLRRDVSSYFTFMCEGDHKKAVQFGHNYRGTHDARLEVWTKGVGYQELAAPEVTACEIIDADWYRVVLDIVLDGGRLFAGVDGLQTREADLPGNLPAARRIGFWGREFGIEAFTITAPQAEYF